jgi:hypothetical protein
LREISVRKVGQSQAVDATTTHFPGRWRYSRS